MSITEKLEAEIAKAGVDHLHVVWDGFEVKDLFRAMQIDGTMEGLQAIGILLNTFSPDKGWAISSDCFGGPKSISTDFELFHKRSSWSGQSAKVGDWIVIDQKRPIPTVVTRDKFAELKTVPYTSDLLTEMKSLMDFGKALQALKAGKCVARKGWNASGMFVYYVAERKRLGVPGPEKDHFGVNTYVDLEPYFALKTVRNTSSTWVPSISDCLAEDWFLVNDKSQS